MSKNEQGSLLIDALLALSIIAVMVLLLQGAYRCILITTEKEKEETVDLYELYQEGTRIYDD